MLIGESYVTIIQDYHPLYGSLEDNFEEISSTGTETCSNEPPVTMGTYAKKAANAVLENGGYLTLIENIPVVNALPLSHAISTLGETCITVGAAQEIKAYLTQAEAEKKNGLDKVEKKAEFSNNVLVIAKNVVNATLALTPLMAPISTVSSAIAIGTAVANNIGTVQKGASYIVTGTKALTATETLYSKTKEKVAERIDPYFTFV